MAREKDIRAAKEDLVERFAEQKKRGGFKPTKSEQDHPAFHAEAVPDMQAIESYIDPILSKVDRKLSGEYEVDPDPEVDEELVPRQRKTEIDEYMGTYEWDLGTDEITPVGNAWRPEMTDEERVRRIVQRLLLMPEWETRFESARRICGHHQQPKPVKGCKNCERRDRKYQKILLDAYRKFGNPNKPKDGRIMVS